MLKLPGKSDAPDKREVGPAIHQLSEICPITVRNVPYRAATQFTISGSIIMTGGSVLRLRRLLPLVFAMFAAASIPAGAQSTRPPSHHTAKPHNPDNRVHVRGYTKKYGTHVAPYTRSYPHTKSKP